MLPALCVFFGFLVTIILTLTGSALYIQRATRIRYDRRISVCKYGGVWGACFTRDLHQQIEDYWLPNRLRRETFSVMGYDELPLLTPRRLTLFHNKAAMDAVLDGCFVETVQFHVPLANPTAWNLVNAFTFWRSIHPSAVADELLTTAINNNYSASASVLC